jgi:hypothetical protein
MNNKNLIGQYEKEEKNGHFVFITDNGDFYADMKRTSLDEGTYQWLSSHHIDRCVLIAYEINLLA